MNGSRRVFVLGLLCGLVASALAAAPASANTLYKCDAVGSEASFSDEHCLNAGSGPGFVHTPIAPNTATPVTATSERTVEGTTASSTAKLKGVAAAIETEIQCTTLGSSGTEMENKEEGVTRWIEGSGQLLFSGCSVTKPAGKGCVVNGGAVGTKSLLGSTKGLVSQVKVEPFSGTELASIKIESCSVAGLNKTFPLTGNLIADVSGATISATHTGITAQGNLRFAGQKAGFEGAITLEDTATGSGLVGT